MVGHLDLEPGLKHLAHQGRQQAAFAGQFDAVGPGPVDQLDRQSRIAGSSPTNGTLRGPDRSDPAPRLVGVEAEVAAEVEVINRDPAQPATLSRGPSDHPQLHRRTVPNASDPMTAWREMLIESRLHQS